MWCVKKYAMCVCACRLLPLHRQVGWLNFLLLFVLLDVGCFGCGVALGYVANQRVVGVEAEFAASRHGQHAWRCASDEHGLHLRELVAMGAAVLHSDAIGLADAQHHVAGDSAQHRLVGGGEQVAVAVHHENVGAAALGDLVVAVE